MTTYTATIQQDENGEAFIEIPVEIVARYNLKDGDPVAFDMRDGALVMTFPKQADE